MRRGCIVAFGLIATAADAPAESISGAYHCKQSGTAVCGPEACTGAGIIQQHPVSLNFDTRIGSISLAGLRGSISQQSPDHCRVIWDFDLGKPTELTVRVVQPVGVMATLRSPDRTNEFICKRR